MLQRTIYARQEAVQVRRIFRDRMQRRREAGGCFAEAVQLDRLSARYTAKIRAVIAMARPLESMKPKPTQMTAMAPVKKARWNKCLFMVFLLFECFK
ncbi:hypothetical protein LP420_10055 [Massilia sp. B-10]|nr:hypothetical protein LP420_10055 [Massilia sp. B-10]